MKFSSMVMRVTVRTGRPNANMVAISLDRSLRLMLVELNAIKKASASTAICTPERKRITSSNTLAVESTASERK